MSLYTASSSFLTLRPKVREEPPLLVITTGFLTSLLTLGLKRRRVEIDTLRKEIRIQSRYLWLIPEEATLSFTHLSHLEYRYDAVPTSFGLSLEGFGRKDEVDIFTIAVVDRDGREFKLCSYRGEGSVHTGWTGVLLSDDSMMDFTGTQEGESRQLVNMIKAILQIPIGKPVLEDIQKITCPHCGREVAAFAVKCIYCAKSLKD